MALGVPLAGWAIATTALAAGASGVQAANAKSQAISGRRLQQRTQQAAETQALAAQNRADMEERKANPNQPDALALLGREQLASLQGVGSATSLTGAPSKPLLGKQASLGAV